MRTLTDSIGATYSPTVIERVGGVSRENAPNRAADHQAEPSQSSSRRGRSASVQAKLEVGASDDPAELEADRIAAEVMSVIRSNSGDVAPGVEAPPTRIARSTHAIDGAGGTVDSATEGEVRAARSGGRPLEPRLQRSMEGAFGADFSNVRLHLGPRSDALNERIQARAFTVGSDIFVRGSDYSPASADGQRLIAHELTHTVQQGAVRVRRSTGPARARVPSAPSERIRRASGRDQQIRRELSPDSTDPADWNNLTGGSTGPGVTGVIFVEKGTEGIVVKGLDEPPQRAMLAQAMMEKVGVATTNTKPVAVGSALGQHILDQLDQLGQTLTAAPDPEGAAITAKVAAWRAGQTLLLMEPADVKNLQQLVVTGPDVPALAGDAAAQFGGGDPHQVVWHDILNTAAVWHGFGAMFYVDQFLGNEDRFESLKIQNVFLDSADRVMALDNDTMAPAYVRAHTIIDSTMGIEQRQEETQTPDEYVAKVIGGGQVIGSTRAMASLDQIAGTPGELRALTDAKVDDLLNMLDVATAGAPGDANKAAANAEVTALIGGGNANMQKTAMFTGATAASMVIVEMFRSRIGKSPFKKLFDAQNTAAGRDQKDKAMYSDLALGIRHAYLGRRAAGEDHATALAGVQGDFRRKVSRSAKTATTTRSLDAADMQQEQFVLN